MEAAELGIFMISACVFTALIQYPGSPVHDLLPDPFLRRLLTGLAMACTAVLLVFSGWGKQSGAHINPSITLTFFRLGKIKKCDALGYIVCQFLGGLLGACGAAVVLSRWASHPAVNYVVTAPGNSGVAGLSSGQ